MTIDTAAGTRFFIGPTPVAPGTTSLSAYKAVDWVEVNEVEDLGEFGDDSNPVNFTALKDSRVRKLKGARDAGTIAVTVGRDPQDIGQSAVFAAAKTNDNYQFKVLADDGLGSAADSVFFFDGLIMSARMRVGSVDNVVRMVYNLGINSAILEDEETPTP